MALASNANPAILKWARESEHLSIELVSESLKLSPGLLVKWEAGDGTPSLSQLRRLAKKYRRPTMIFYLRKRPTEFAILKDFRRLPDAARQSTPKLLRMIRVAQERQAWASMYLSDSGAGKSTIIKTAKVSRSPRNLGRRIRELLGVPLAEQFGWGADSKAFSAWKKAIEAAGVFVFQTERFPLEEVRGCALCDEYAPVVIVNGQDNYRARSFTLMHELTHIFLGLTAISGGSLDDSENTRESEIERFCNAAAAEVLVPLDDFVARVPRNWKDNDDETLSRLSDRYRVSRFVIAIRLTEAGLAGSDYLSEKWPLLQRKPKAKRPSNSGPPPYRRALARSGESFVRLALSAYDADDIHGGELYDLLRMGLANLPDLEQELHPGRVIPTEYL